MKKLPFCILFASVLFLTHCASDSSDDSTPSPTGTMTLTGTLEVETVSGLGVKSVVAASDYAVVAIDNETNETYRATTDEAGVFSIEVPSSIADVTTMRWGSSLGVLEADYPEKNSLWSGSVG